MVDKGKPGDSNIKETVLAIAWGAYDTIRWFSELDSDAISRRLLLLDPIEKAAGVHSSLPWDEAKITRLAAIPSNQSGETEIISYSHPGLFSLQPTTPALRQLLPGLRIKKTVTTEHVSAEALSALLGREDETFCLILETPGAELQVLDLLEKAKLLERANSIYLRCGTEAFFENAPDERQIRRWLKERFFQITDRNSADPDWPQLAFAADLDARRIPVLEKAQSERDRLEEALAGSRVQAEADARAIAERDAALRTAHLTRDQLQNALETEQESVKSHKAEIGNVRNTLQATEEALSRARTDCERTRNEMAKVLEDLRATQAERDTLEEALTGARVQAEADARAIAERDAALRTAQLTRDQLRKALETEQGSVKSHKAGISSVRNTLHETEEALSRARTDCERTRNDMSMALENLRATRTDLTDLRDRYAKLYDEKSQLEHLIQKLTPRLQEASGQLREIFASPGGNEPVIAHTQRNKSTAKKK